MSKTRVIRIKTIWCSMTIFLFTFREMSNRNIMSYMRVVDAASASNTSLRGAVTELRLPRWAELMTAGHSDTSVCSVGHCRKTHIVSRWMVQSEKGRQLTLSTGSSIDFFSTEVMRLSGQTERNVMRRVNSLNGDCNTNERFEDLCGNRILVYCIYPSRFIQLTSISGSKANVV